MAPRRGREHVGKRSKFTEEQIAFALRQAECIARGKPSDSLHFNVIPQIEPLCTTRHRLREADAIAASSTCQTCASGTRPSSDRRRATATGELLRVSTATAPTPTQRRCAAAWLGCSTSTSPTVGSMRCRTMRGLCPHSAIWPACSLELTGNGGLAAWHEDHALKVVGIRSRRSQSSITRRGSSARLQRGTFRRHNVFSSYKRPSRQRRLFK